MMNTDYMTYVSGLMVFGVLIFISGLWIAGINPANLVEREKLPRNIWLGIIIAVISLFWCIPHSKPRLPDSMHKFLIPAAIICSIIAYNFLDYLFSRALGGFFILLAHYFLHASFTLHTPAAPLFACFCFAMGIIGIFLAGKPYLFRDYIRKAASSNRFRLSGASFCYIFGLFSFTLGILHLTMRR